MAHRPKFRYLARSNCLQLKPTQVTHSVAAANKSKPVTTPAMSPDEVEAQAWATIPARQQATPQLILARSELQFGQYRGQTFQWLLEHAVGYAVGLIDSVQKELQPEVDTPLGVNKRKFCEYALAFCDVQDAIHLRQMTVAAEAKVASTGDEGERLVGFGQYRSMTWRQLCDSADREHQSFVRQFLMHTDCQPGSRLDQFKAYCWRRHRQETIPPPLPVPQAAVQTDSEATDVDVEELLAAVHRLESG